MARKYEMITELYRQSLQEITSRPESWTAFLRSACRNYRLPFDEQVLVHAQRPDAVAVLEIEGENGWNKRFGRWVNRGAKGIAVFDLEYTHGTRLKYYFDISDTHESRFARPVPLLEMQPAYEADIIETLENSFGELESKENLAAALLSTAKNAVEDNMPDYLDDLLISRENSFLKELDDFNVEVAYRDALQTSVAYMLMTRCGIDADEYLIREDFSNLLNFNTPETVNALGAAVSDIAEMGLSEIARTVRNLQKTDKKNRTFAEKPNRQYPDTANQMKQPERSLEYGTDIRNAGRLQPAESDRAGRAGDSPWEIRPATPGISEAAPQGAVHESSDLGQADGVPDGNREGRAELYGADRDGAGESRGRDGGTESPRPNDVGRNDEQLPTRGGGDYPQGTDNQLTLLPSAEEQQNTIEAEAAAKVAEKASAFAIPQEDIDAVLQDGSGVQDGKFRIFEQFQKSLSQSENAKFLKEEYGWGGRLDEAHDGKGITISRGSITNPDASFTLSWNKAAKRISELIKLDRYLSAKEKAHYPAYLEQAEERRLQAVEAAARDVLSRAPQEASPAKRENARYDYHLGNTVYLGAEEYEILAFDENEVRLFDVSFPLINKVLTRAEFDAKVRENPMNDHLLAADEPEPPTAPSPDSESRADEMLRQPEGAELPGKEVIIDGHRFAVESVNDSEVNLRDLTFAGSVGFPIFRLEKTDTVRRFLEAQTPAETAPQEPVADTPETVKLRSIVIDLTAPAREEDLPAKKEEVLAPPPVRPEKASPFVLHPEIPTNQRHNFQITDDHLGEDGAKSKFKNNAAAIRTLQEIEFDNRLATPEEQEILSRYVGWGGLPQAFDEGKEDWANEFIELQTLLSPEEYEAAKATTLNAHYTSPAVIKAIYQAVENMGFRTGNVLEPSYGIGNFFGLVPESMKDSKLFGVELDSITGRIARQLYQQNSIAVQGFEETELPESFFDLVVGNVPFGSYSVYDKKYNKHRFLIHDYFFARTLDKVRPGGIVAFVTSKGTMDKKNPDVRKYIAQRAELIGAIRLPNNAFLANAGTQVTTDVIFLQKREKLIDVSVPDENTRLEWLHLGQTENGVPINQYFLDHPEMVLGEMAYDDMMYGNAKETTCKPFEGASLPDLLAEAVQNIHAEYTNYEIEELDGEDEDKSIPADPDVRNFSYTLVDGAIYYWENSRMFPVEQSLTGQSRVKGMIAIRDCVRRLIEYQTESAPDEIVEREQRNLNRLYSVTSPLPKTTALSASTTTCGKSWSSAGFPKKKSPLSMRPPTKRRKRNCSQRCARALFVCCSALPLKWEPGQTCRTGSSPCTIWIVRGGPVIWSSDSGGSCGRKTKIQRWKFSAMLPRGHSIPIYIRWWRTSSGLSLRCSRQNRQPASCRKSTTRRCPMRKSRRWPPAIP